jgi:hypothetical protein
MSAESRLDLIRSAHETYERRRHNAAMLHGARVAFADECHLPVEERRSAVSACRGALVTIEEEHDIVVCDPDRVPAGAEGLLIDTETYAEMVADYLAVHYPEALRRAIKRACSTAHAVDVQQGARSAGMRTRAA